MVLYTVHCTPVHVPCTSVMLYLSTHADMSSGFEGGFGDTAIEVLHLLLSHLLQGSEEDVGVSQESINTFVDTLRRDFPRERVPVVLAPLLYREQLDITEDRWNLCVCVCVCICVCRYTHTVKHI